MKSYNSRETRYMALKLDMSKAYDRVEWVFLENLMRKMGFCEKWIRLIMVCVKFVTYSILVNGEPKGMITPTRGIRQGDPLSPFLFLLCTKGLHVLINDAATLGEITSFSFCRSRPKLTHLLFVDDSLLFCRAAIEKCATVLNTLETYENVSSQKVNMNNTSLFFSKSTLEVMCHAIKETLGVKEIHQYEKYLGLPSLVGRGKRESFNFLKERVWKKLQGWEGKLLS